jgi:hypothetical protein
MASDEVNLKPAGRNGSADPKPGGGRSADPKPGGGRSADPKPGGGRGATDGSSFGVGTGLVVVSFISTVSMDIAELAARIVRGGGSGPQPGAGGSRRVRAIGDIAVLAQKEARQETQKQLQQAQSLEQAKKHIASLEHRVEQQQLNLLKQQQLNPAKQQRVK